jgi:hypothetical protein
VCTETENALTLEGLEGYETICEWSEWLQSGEQMGTPTMEMLSSLSEIEMGSYEGDFVSALVVGVNHLKKASTEKMTRRVVMITAAAGKIEDMDQVCVGGRLNRWAGENYLQHRKENSKHYNVSQEGMRVCTLM